MGPVELGQAVDGFLEKVRRRVLLLVPLLVYLGVLQAVVRAHVDDPAAGYASARNDLKDYQFSIDTPMFHSKQVMWLSTPKSRDFWNPPEYKELLDIQQREVSLCYIGLQEPKETLDKVALLQQQVVDTSPYNPKNQ